MENLFFKMVARSRSRFFTSFLLLTLSMLLMLSLIDYWSNNDTTISSSTSILNDENVQYEIRKSESKFRDKIFLKLRALAADKNFSKIDTILNNSKESLDVKKYIILNRLKKQDSKHKFDITVDKSTSPIIVLRSITCTFEIDPDRLNNIIQSSKYSINEENIRYGNFLKTTFTYNKYWRYDYVIILIFVVLAIYVFLYFKNKIGLKDKDQLSDIVENLEDNKKIVREAEDRLNEDDVTNKEIEELKLSLKKVQDELQSYQFDSILNSVLYVDVIKAERKSMELYNRSTLMLILGLLIAIAGILIFYFTLPEFRFVKAKYDYFVLTIRPTLILIFVQSISFYLLRQYRSLISDYKYFYQEYLKKSRIFISYQLMQDDNISDLEHKLIDNLLEDKPGIKNTDDKDDLPQLPPEKVLDLVKGLIEKIKG